jgi:hypothetical protein
VATDLTCKQIADEVLEALFTASWHQDFARQLKFKFGPPGEMGPKHLRQVKEHEDQHIASVEVASQFIVELLEKCTCKGK